MISRLTGGQRLWLMFSIVLLGSTIALIAVIWPRPEPGLVADLRDSECASWRELPAERIPDAFPEPGQRCYWLRSFMFREHLSLPDETAYESYLSGVGTTKAAYFLLGWAVLSAAGYFLAWSSARVVSTALQRRSGPGGGRGVPP